jgi:mRNA-decapping enzyme subunit 2
VRGLRHVPATLTAPPSHWFYEDFVRPDRPDLPALTLRRFSELFLISCSPHLSAFSFDPKAAYDAFLLYKSSIPVRGAVLMNAKLDKVVMVKGWKSSAGWGFPRGKINKSETDRDCAVREVRLSLACSRPH